MLSPLERLPIEVFDQIAREVKHSKSSLTPLALASRSCQLRAEGSNFGSLCLEENDIPDFDKLVVEHRLRALKDLTIKLGPSQAPGPPLRGDPGFKDAVRLSRDDSKAKDQEFTAWIRMIFTMLENKAKSLPEGQHSIRKFRLQPGGILPYNCKYLEDQDRSRGIQFETAWVRLLSEEIPEDLILSDVAHLSIKPDWFCPNRLWPASWCELALRCPNLETLCLNGDDHEWKSLRSRKQARDAFGLGLTGLPSTVKHLELNYHSPAPGNGRCTPPDLTDRHTMYDILSHELGMLAQRLVTLKLESATLDLVEFFTACAESEFCSLERLDFSEMIMVSANGTWYSILDPRDETDEADLFDDAADESELEEMREWMNEDDIPTPMDHPPNGFRGVIDPTAFTEIYVAAAGAVARMPRLRRLVLHFEELDALQRVRGNHCFEYSHGSVKSDYFPRDTADIVAFWDTCLFDFRPRLVEAWKAVGIAKDASIDLFYEDWEDGPNAQRLGADGQWRCCLPGADS